MKSSVHPKYKTQYHVWNWPAYDRALVQRGDITVWLAPDAIAAWEAVGVGKRGGQRQYSDLAIETALTLRLIFHLPVGGGIANQPRNPLRLSSLVILGVVARMSRCATRSSYWFT